MKAIRLIREQCLSVCLSVCEYDRRGSKKGIIGRKLKERFHFRFSRRNKMAVPASVEGVLAVVELVTTVTVMVTGVKA